MAELTPLTASFSNYPYLSCRMSISVQHLTKIYGEQRTVDDINFEVPAGQIVISGSQRPEEHDHEDPDLLHSALCRRSEGVRI